MILIGIDPGASGGIAWADGDEEPGHMNAAPFAETERDVLDQLRATIELRVMTTLGERCVERECFAVLEAVHSFPGQGVSSSFKFGQSYGFLRGLLIALGIPFETVAPAKWQRAMGVPKTDKKDKKKATKARAQEIHPELRLTHRTADAVLLAEYARRTYAAAHPVGK